MQSDNLGMSNYMFRKLETFSLQLGSSTCLEVNKSYLYIILDITSMYALVLTLEPIEIRILNTKILNLCL